MRQTDLRGPASRKHKLVGRSGYRSAISASFFGYNNAREMSCPRIAARPSGHASELGRSRDQWAKFPETKIWV
jgi:hypothetical protein